MIKIKDEDKNYLHQAQLLNTVQLLDIQDEEFMLNISDNITENLVNREHWEAKLANDYKEQNDIAEIDTDDEDFQDYENEYLLDLLEGYQYYAVSEYDAYLLASYGMVVFYNPESDEHVYVKGSWGYPLHLLEVSYKEFSY